MKGEGKRGFGNVADWILGNIRVLGTVVRLWDNN